MLLEEDCWVTGWLGIWAREGGCSGHVRRMKSSLTGVVAFYATMHMLAFT
jgi:hypothetical protein